MTGGDDDDLSLSLSPLLAPRSVDRAWVADAVSGAPVGAAQSSELLAEVEVPERVADGLLGGRTVRRVDAPAGTRRAFAA